MSDTTSQLPDPFDRMLAEFTGLPDSAKTPERIVRVMPHFGIGGSETFLLTTIRQRDDKDKAADWLFLECVRKGEALRLVLPPEVTSVIAQQRDALTARNRRKGARQAAATRKAKGIKPFERKAK